MIQQGNHLYGVRFGPETDYCLLDIDAASIYHPKRDPFAISRVLEALESLGLTTCIACTSSYSGGIHLYFPFTQTQKTWELALALQIVLENAGFKPALGQLELFPNVRLHLSDSNPSLYAAHRLPMQAGSYILSADWELTCSNRHTFVQRWRFAQKRNQLEAKVLRRIIRLDRRQRYQLSGRADKFFHDLNTEIEPGWTGQGQTNYLLGRIAMRSYIFGHLIGGCEPLEGQDLVRDIVRVAQSLPGYRDWCRHQHELEKRAAEWAACVENSHYFHFGSGSKASLHSGHPKQQSDRRRLWNQQQAEAARERIRTAIADLLEKGCLPSRIRARFTVLTTYGIGGSSLYKHKDLWHPAHLWKNPPEVTVDLNPDQEDCAGGASSDQSSKSLFPDNGGNTLIDRPFQPVEVAAVELTGCNKPVDTRVQQRQRATTERMQRYLESGDPILINEALTWARSHPDCLQIPPELQISPETLEESQPAVGSESLSGSCLAIESFPVVSPNLLPPDLAPPDPADLSLILVKLEVQKQRLGWSESQLGQALGQLFGHAHQVKLDDLELVWWLQWLESQPAVNQSASNQSVLKQIDPGFQPDQMTGCQNTSDQAKQMALPGDSPPQGQHSPHNRAVEQRYDQGEDSG